MTTRAYGQFCGLAAALDLLGERWTLLIVRELLMGPRRFKDLDTALAGAGPNLLASRLRRLVSAGVVRDDPVPEDGRGRMYSLTSRGTELRGTILDLSRWGLGVLHDDDLVRRVVRAEWAQLALESMVRGRTLAPDVNEAYEFRIDDTIVTVLVDDGAVTVVEGPHSDPCLVLVADARTFVEIGARITSPAQALVGGSLRMTGDVGAVDRVLDVLGLAQQGHA